MQQLDDMKKIAIFKGKNIRKILHNGEWWFVINDVIEALTDSSDPAQYFKRLKERDPELEKLTARTNIFTAGMRCQRT